jgi:hypothetical protein
VVKAAGVSRRTFYMISPNVEECVLALLRERLQIAGAVVQEAFGDQEI